MPQKTMEELTQEAFQKAVNATLISAISGEGRDAIILTAVTKYLNDWDFKHAIEQQFKMYAEKMAAEAIASGQFAEQVKDAIKVGLEILILQLPAATAAMLAEALFGRIGKDHYDRSAGLILKHLKLPDSNKESP